MPQLIAALRGEPDEHKRASAAEELRQFDIASFPEIVPALIDCALHDAETGVRIDAVQSLGKIRPVSQAAGWALEHVLSHDKSMRVRMQARTSLYQYYVSGYRSNGKGGEPPLVPGEGTKPQAAMLMPPAAAPGMVYAAPRPLLQPAPMPMPLPLLQPMSAPVGIAPTVPVPAMALNPSPAFVQPQEPAPAPIVMPTEPPGYQPLPTGPVPATVLKPAPAFGQPQEPTAAPVVTPMEPPGYQPLPAGPAADGPELAPGQ